MRLLRPVLLLLVFLFTACAGSSSTPPPETEPALNVSKPELPGYAIKRAKKAPYAIVLVHGITGNGRSSWTSQKGTYWPKLMEDDRAFDNFDIYVHEYPTSIFGGCMAVSDLATTMHAHLKSDSVFENHERVIFLAHSMGGLIVRTFLLRYREKADRVPMVIFMATPSAGSWKANVGNLFTTCSQVEDLRTLDVNSFLKSQQSDWLSSNFQDQIASYCAVETQPSGGSLTVGRSSASLLCTREPLPLPTNHSDTVKPDTTSDLPHIFLKNALSDLPTLQNRLRTNSLGTGATHSGEQTTREAPVKVDVPTKEPHQLSQEWRSPTDETISLLVPRGEFIMGSNDGDDDEKPEHKVFVDSFYMDKFEVTTARYSKFLKATRRVPPPYWSQAGAGDGNKPVIGISYDDAEAFCKWAKKRLPTEAEWEKAARGTDARKYPWGNVSPTDMLARFSPSSFSTWRGYDSVTEVGSFPNGRSPYGIFDLAGNAYEWVQDWYDPDYYRNAPSQNPLGPADVPASEARAYRGGSWHQTDEKLRSSDRGYNRPQVNLSYVGIRCVKSAD